MKPSQCLARSPWVCLAIFFVLAGSILPNANAQEVTAGEAHESRFSWANPIVYQVLTDRFVNGDPRNDHSYGRGLDGNGKAYSAGPEFFEGGDFAGLIEKVRSNYFTELGVNVLWISAPYEQVHGFVPGGNGSRQTYAYHGYWPLDFTSLDANWGTEAEFAALIAACHDRGIRVVIDVVLNHAGYATVNDMDEFDFGGLTDSIGWQQWRPTANENWSTYYDRFVSYADSSTNWGSWWNAGWIRAGLPGYVPCGNDERTECLNYLPDFRTDSKTEVSLPAFLVSKWSDDKLKQEQSELADFFTRTGLAPTPRNYLVKWLTDWVRDYGVDGYRIDTAKHVEFETWEELKFQANLAYSEWQATTTKRLPDAEEFWMLGEVYGYDGSESEYFAHGFDALLNFAFQSVAEESLQALDQTFVEYSEKRTLKGTNGLVSYLSSHDVGVFDRDALWMAATNLMLAPGGVTIFYGDETGRRASAGIEDRALASRGVMNWDSIDQSLLSHWQLLGQFRQRHPSIAAGTHTVLSEEPYVFMRRLDQPMHEDAVVVASGAVGRTRIYVSKAFPDDAIVRDAVSGRSGFVSFGYVTINADESGLVLLEMVSD